MRCHIRNSILSGLIFLLLFASCATYITTDRGYAIYVNGKYKGTEKIKISRTGISNKKKIEVRKKGMLLGKKTITRKITINTILFACLSPIGLLLFWQYPKKIHIKPKSMKPIWLSTSKDQKSIWNNPTKK